MLYWILTLAVVSASQAEVDGVKAGIVGRECAAKISIETIGRFEVQIALEPAGEREAVRIHVELPGTGPGTWPAEGVYVVDESGQGIPIRRNGIEWHRFEMTVPPIRRAYTVRAENETRARQTSNAVRTTTDPISGITASLCPWYGAKKAALCMRFDDSDPTHLSKAMPILREYGYRATFMINPGSPGFREHQEEWEARAKSGVHEFANHTMNHRGAASEDEIRREVGEVSEYVWRLFPGRSKLVALNRGGGTHWTTTRPFSDYLEEYHLFPVSGSLGMDDVYGNRASALEAHVARHIGRGGWCRVHFHSIGEGRASSEENFRAALDVVKKYEEQLWITGLADAYKYQEERRTAKLALTSRSSDPVFLQLSCGTDSELYDQMLTVQLDVSRELCPATVSLTKEGEEAVLATGRVDGPERGFLRFDVRPEEGRYLMSVERRSGDGE